ncbi:acyl-coenzyme A thioesterase 13 isoform X2 [Solenopsis invicta]|nr:acyl-coenzyme A thioesterase 13 isoform X2 [Solenopsis invicta]XP_011163915.1 acyl-coenzyme A thioesterase 13 isoform X2 [Solenopsis invicta]XP_025992052.1 acyl-coenzyme A thioesterase 13 isoform X2 [Solenopsis invicta]XP_025992053.1 acyl-coenzyme A thioesterase 13 isoform X2 [Solenopsis invicta]XP_039311015.1 acyl-coenzyme A thioesterase 13 isoform X2 [Solenopsis invicta]
MSCKMELIKTVLGRMVNTKGFDRCMKNIKLLSAGDGKCKAQFTVAEEHLNPGGFLHGGFTATIIDGVSTCALMTYKTDTPPGASIDLHVTYLKAAFPGETVTVDAKTLRAGKNLAFLTVELTKNDGKDIVAHGQHTKYLGGVKQ